MIRTSSLLYVAYVALSAMVAVLPKSVQAQVFNPNDGVGGLFNFITRLISNSLIPLLFAGALLLFVFGVVSMALNPNNEKKREEGRQFMLWGVIGLAVMTAVWGLVFILTRTFFGGTTFLPQLAD